MASRQSKYPNTKTFNFHNQNPKGRVTGDCVFRAISLATNKPYNECVIEMAQLMCETGYALNDNKGIEKYLSNLGWVKHKQPRKANNTKYTGKEFCSKVVDKSKRYIANIGGHHIVAIVDGKVNDIWDSTDGCIGNYWTLD